MNWYVDASVLLALARLGELDLLVHLDGTPMVPEPVEDELRTEPEMTALEALLDRDDVRTVSLSSSLERARETLGERRVSGDVAVVAAVIDAGGECGVVADDARVRRTVRSLGADLTGTIGVLARAVHAGELAPETAKRRLAELDEGGSHMTATLRERGEELIDRAATD